MQIVFAKDGQWNNKLSSHWMFGDWNQSRKMFQAIFFCLVWVFGWFFVVVCLFFCYCLPKLRAAWNPWVWFGSGLVLVWPPEQENRPGASLQSVGWLGERLSHSPAVGHSRSSSCLGLLWKTYHCTMIKVLDLWMQSLRGLVLTVMKPYRSCWIACMSFLLHGVVRLQEAQQNKSVKQAPSVWLRIKQRFLSAKTVWCFNP